MPMICGDGNHAVLPARVPPVPRERGAPWSPPNTAQDRCERCGRQAWQHAAVLEPIARAS